MQIKGIFLYSNFGQTRYVSFEPGKLNIVSGISGTGKSSLLRITDYCLGGSNKIPIEIREVVSWYGIHLIAADGSEIQLARQEALPRKETSAMYVARGVRLDLPSFRDLNANATVESALDVLAENIGLSSIVLALPESSTRPEYDATVRHVARFSFQFQNEIAQNQYLFHGQENYFESLSIGDTLPFLLGVTNDSWFMLRRRLRYLKRQSSRLQREIAALEYMDQQANALSRALVAGAMNVGLVEVGPIPDDAGACDSLLNLALERSVLNDLYFTDEDASLGLRSLEAQRDELVDKYRAIRDTLSTLKALDGLQSQYNEIGEREDVCSSAISLIGTVASLKECPLCGSGEVVEFQHALERDLAMLRESRLTRTQKSKRLQHVIDKYQGEADDLKAQIQEAVRAISLTVQSVESERVDRDNDIQAAKMLGRIEFYFDTRRNFGTVDLLADALAKIEMEIAQIEDVISDEQYAKLKRDAESDLSLRMTRVGRSLNHMYRNEPIRLDIGKASVSVGGEASGKSLQDIGSAGNHLAIHIAAHLGLHERLTERMAPSLRFLFLDQPTQAYYPPDRDPATFAGDLSDVRDDDRRSVDVMFRALKTWVEDMGGRFQIIITDHAYLRDPDFQKSIVARWDDGDGLIPPTWFQPRI